MEARFPKREGPKQTEWLGENPILQKKKRGLAVADGRRLASASIASALLTIDLVDCGLTPRAVEPGCMQVLATMTLL